MTPLDLRFALRRLRRHLPASLAAALTLALGLAAVTALFSVVRAVLLRPPPFQDPAALVVVRPHLANQADGRLEVSYPDYRDWRATARGFQDLAAVQTALGRTVLETGGEPRSAAGTMVSGHFFDLLGAHPALGRTLRPDDDRPGAEPVLILSDPLWRGAFGGRPDAVGRRVRLDGIMYTVVGVMPPGFEYPRMADFWRAVVPAVDSLAENRTIGFLTVIGRLAPGTTPADAEADLSRVAEETGKAGRPADLHYAVALTPLTEQLTGRIRPVLLALFGATVLVLAIACVNVASLLLAQAPGRRRELAVLTALGAARGRVVRQLLLESLVLGLFGGGLGLLLAAALVRIATGLVPQELFQAGLVRVDGPVALFAVLAAILASLAFGLAPAAGSGRTDLHGTLREGGRASPGRGGRRLLRTLVIGETAVAMVLLVGAGLLLHAWLRLAAVDPGPDPERTLTVQVFSADPTLSDVTRSHAMFDRLVERAAAIPGVDAAAGVLIRPLEGPQGFDYPFTVEGRSREEQAGNPFLNYEAVTPDYFRATGLPVLQGRALTAADRADAPRFVILGRSVARRLWPGADPVGRRIKWGGPDSPSPWTTVVGVVEDGRYRGLETVSLDAYVPHDQSPWPLNHLVLRTRSDPDAVAAALRREAAALDPGLRLLDAATVGTMMRAALARPRFAATLFVGLGATALLLAAVGLAGVLWFTTRQRTREIGIRMALGASPGRIRLEVLREGAGLTLAGLAVGALAALALTRVLGSLLYQVGPRDPGTYAAVTLTLGTVAFAACFVPAWRASREDAVVALRAEDG
jgi:putative ABC transport system permease protein